MKVALVGSNGYIARHIMNALDNNIEILKIDKQEEVALDLIEADKFDYKMLDDVDYVVFTAAISGPDMCAEQYELCWNINVVGTERFIAEAIDRGCRIIFFSSDAVYGDIEGKVYDEYSIRNPNTPYGIMKKHVEDTFGHNLAFKAIRLTYVVSANDKFVSYCLGCAERGEQAEVFHPFYRNCTVVSDVIRTVKWLLYNWEQCEESYINVCGDELVSRLQIVDELNDILDNKIKYTIQKPPEHFFDNRPMITRVKSVVNKKYGIYKQDTFFEKIKREVEE